MELKIMNVKEIAKYLNISKDSVYELVRTKKIPHVRVGRRILFQKNSIDSWFADQENKNSI